LLLRSPTPESTQDLGAALARAIDADGAIILLAGPLGAGKTCFVKGLAAGLGIPADRVQSPTFVIAQELPLPTGGFLVHVDCYRIASESELESAGLLDWLVPGALVVAEWGERVPGAWPEDRLEIAIARDATERRLAPTARGVASQALLTRWREGLPAGFR
jgi:tRNA threonylcarbamoyladenosine biosynthesis protein TsaE